MSLQGWIWVVGCTALVVAANLLLRIGIQKSDIALFSTGLSGVPRQFLTLALNPVFCLALLLYVASMLVWFRIVATQPLSIAYPALAALTFVVLTIAGALLFKEPLSIQKAAGIVVTLVGLTLISSA